MASQLTPNEEREITYMSQHQNLIKERAIDLLQVCGGDADLALAVLGGPDSSVCRPDLISTPAPEETAPILKFPEVADGKRTKNNNKKKKPPKADAMLAATLPEAGEAGAVASPAAPDPPANPPKLTTRTESRPLETPASAPGFVPTTSVSAQNEICTAELDKEREETEEARLYSLSPRARVEQEKATWEGADRPLSARDTDTPRPREEHEKYAPERANPIPPAASDADANPRTDMPPNLSIESAVPSTTERKENAKQSRKTHRPPRIEAPPPTTTEEFIARADYFLEHGFKRMPTLADLEKYPVRLNGPVRKKRTGPRAVPGSTKPSFPPLPAGYHEAAAADWLRENGFSVPPSLQPPALPPSTQTAAPTALAPIDSSDNVPAPAENDHDAEKEPTETAALKRTQGKGNQEDKGEAFQLPPPPPGFENATVYHSRYPGPPPPPIFVRGGFTVAPEKVEAMGKWLKEIGAKKTVPVPFPAAPFEEGVVEKARERWQALCKDKASKTVSVAPPTQLPGAIVSAPSKEEEEEEKMPDMQEGSAPLSRKAKKRQKKREKAKRAMNEPTDKVNPSQEDATTTPQPEHLDPASTFLIDASLPPTIYTLYQEILRPHAITQQFCICPSLLDASLTLSYLREIIESWPVHFIPSASSPKPSRARTTYRMIVPWDEGEETGEFGFDAWIVETNEMVLKVTVRREDRETAMQGVVVLEGVGVNRQSVEGVLKGRM